MKLRMIGCSHQTASVRARERVAFTTAQVPEALERFRNRFPLSEAVLLSTCNRMEIYLAALNSDECPSHRDIVEFVAGFHGLDAVDIFEDLFERTGEDAVRHLFTVAASLDSMVLGEAQILAQVKQAYELACAGDHAGALLNLAFQRAIRVARRIANETAVNQKRVSIPSVAVADFACQIFERFDDKRVLVAGAGEMAEETLKYLAQQGARRITIVNRSSERARALAESFKARSEPWDRLLDLIVESDLMISAVGAERPILTVDQFRTIAENRAQRALFLLDLAVPRNIEPEIGGFQGVYLYSIDDLSAACERNRKSREKELPKASRIVDEESRRFIFELRHRATGPTIQRLKERAEELKSDELSRLLKRLGPVEPHARDEIDRAFERLVNKLLHPPLESLRDHAERGAAHGLFDAFVQLFKLKD